MRYFLNWLESVQIGLASAVEKSTGTLREQAYIARIYILAGTLLHERILLMLWLTVTLAISGTAVILFSAVLGLLDIFDKVQSTFWKNSSDTQSNIQKPTRKKRTSTTKKKRKG